MEPVDLTKPAAAAVDPVNVYAVISLVAALLGLFPIAIVFGMLAFTRPAGRGIAIAGLVLGVLELAVLVIAFVGFTSAFSDDSSDDAAATSTMTVTVPYTPPPSPATTTSPPAAPAPAPPIETTTEPEPASGPALNETCSEGQASVIGTDVNTGQNIVCTYLGAGGGYKWVQSAEISPGTHESGEACDPATDKVGRTSAGTALICIGSVNGGGGEWSVGP